jgi:hypothetical protein
MQKLREREHDTISGTTKTEENKWKAFCVRFLELIR